MNVAHLNPSIIIELRYASANNFTKQPVYTKATCLLVAPAAHALNAVQLELQQQGLGLKVWDAYRPFSAQEKLWSIVPDPRYVAPPHKGGRHTRGTAVDVTLVDRHGNELEMPTDFDDFSEKAHRSYQHSSAAARKNCALLEKIMVNHGFKPYINEWWHFDYKNWQSYPPLNVPL